VQKGKRRRLLLNRRLRERIVKAAQESAPVELRLGELVGSAGLLDRAARRSSDYAQHAIRSLRDGAQIVARFRMHERQIDRLALGDRAPQGACHGGRHRVRPERLNVLADRLARKSERAHPAPPDKVQHDPIAANQDREVGQGSAQGFGHAYFTPEVAAKYLDPSPVYARGASLRSLASSACFLSPRIRRSRRASSPRSPDRGVDATEILDGRPSPIQSMRP